jgi:ABC-2 type transport system permease protein
MLRRLKHLIKKEFIQVWRDTKLRFFIIFPPIVQLIMYGYAINFDIKDIRMAIYDEDHSPESRHLASRFWATDYFRINGGYLANQEQLRQLIDHSAVSFALHIPYDFGKKLKARQTASLQLIVDATDSNAALVVNRYANAILNDYTREILRDRLNRAGLAGEFSESVVIDSRAWFNPNLSSRYSFVPGVIAMVVMLVSLMLTALAVVREKEIGTMEQILVSPIRPLEFMLGKTIPFVLLSLFDGLLVTLVAIFWFEVPFRGSLLVLLLGTLSFLFNSVGLGLLISTVSSTQQQAMMAGTFFLTPAIMLSGLIFPIANMPPVFQYITYLNPLRYFVIVLQSVFLKGLGLAYLWPQMAAMVGLGSAMLGLSVLRFRRRLA